jgi:hypothetical protein
VAAPAALRPYFRRALNPSSLNRPHGREVCGQFVRGPNFQNLVKLENVQNNVQIRVTLEFSKKTPAMQLRPATTWKSRAVGEVNSRKWLHPG